MDRTHLVLIKSQEPLPFGIGSELGAGAEDRTLLIFFVGEVPSPDDNPGMVPQDGIEPPLALYIRQPRCHCATGASIRSFRDRVELFPPAWVAEFFPTPVAEANLAFLIQLLPASFARHKLALGAGLEPARLLVNSQAHCQFCYPRTTWWGITESNCALSIKSRVLRRQSL